MWVEQDVRGHATLAKRHVLSRPQATQDTLLTMPAGKLVSDGGVAWYSHSNAHTLEAACSCVIAARFDVVHHTTLLTPERNRDSSRNLLFFLLYIILVL